MQEPCWLGTRDPDKEKIGWTEKEIKQKKKWGKGCLAENFNLNFSSEKPQTFIGEGY